METRYENLFFDIYNQGLKCETIADFAVSVVVSYKAHSDFYLTIVI